MKDVNDDVSGVSWLEESEGEAEFSHEFSSWHRVGFFVASEGDLA